ncbi:cytosol aminopeptidase-like [Daktulosphaira vitifoliae]|uniref:cytosol aminopeptidase-like n=1 Tax=Daktulosphaira vitifoliae TaxID=58002 RepID=UPI0021AA3A61|nr:cytosol aminopeptidase-like [Daktulosphaira vitifoliae]
MYQNGNSIEFSTEATAFNDRSGGILQNLVANSSVKVGDAILFNNLDKEYPNVAIANVGAKGVSMDKNELMDIGKENIRRAIGKAVVLLQNEGSTKIFTDGMTSPESVAEAATLASWKFEGTKSTKNQSPPATVEPFNQDDRNLFDQGAVFGGAQNLARMFTEIPANILTPSVFADNMTKTLCPCGITVDIQDKDWIEAKKLYGVLEASKGSCEQPLFAVLGYCGGDKTQKPLAFVGHATTHDTGGICLRKCSDQVNKKQHLASGAALVGMMKGIAQLSLPINVYAYIPLFENATSGTAMHVSDVFTALNGVSINVDDTKYASRLAMADTLVYASLTRPQTLINVNTLSGATHRVFGEFATPLFTTSKTLSQEFQRAGATTGDRVWLLPSYDRKRKMVTSDPLADMSVVGEGGSTIDDIAKNAAFGKEFVALDSDIEYAHLDIGGVTINTDTITYPYLREEFATGRLTRTLIQMVYQRVCPHNPPPTSEFNKQRN